MTTETLDQVYVGQKDGMACYVSKDVIAQMGMREVIAQLGLTKRFPVKTDLSGSVVLVEAESQEEAIARYLGRIE